MLFSYFQKVFWNTYVLYYIEYLYFTMKISLLLDGISVIVVKYIIHLESDFVFFFCKKILN